MGFLATLVGAAKSAAADMENALGRMTDAAAFKAVVNASYLMARADGTVTDDEKVKLSKVIQLKLPKFTTKDVVAQLNNAEAELDLSVTAGTMNLLDEIGKQAGKDSAKLIMLAILAVAEADGEFDGQEKVLAKQICGRLGLNARDYGL